MRTFSAVGSLTEESAAWARRLRTTGTPSPSSSICHRDRRLSPRPTNDHRRPCRGGRRSGNFFRAVATSEVGAGGRWIGIALATCHHHKYLSKSDSWNPPLSSTYCHHCRAPQKCEVRRISLWKRLKRSDSPQRCGKRWATLPPADAALIALTAFERYSPAQAAAALGITEGAARTRLHRARVRIAAALGNLEVDTNVTKETSR